VRDLLPVCDSLERGLETDDGAATVESMKEGKALIKRMLDKAMEDHGLTVVNPLGEPFDPELHEAMTVQPSSDAEPGSVLTVVQKGYALNGRLLRPARVIVAASPENNDEQGEN